MARWTQRSQLKQVVSAEIDVQRLTPTGKLATLGIGLTAIVVLIPSGFAQSIGSTDPDLLECSPVEVAALSRHLRISRAHVRNVLRGAEKAGLLPTYASDTKRIVVRPPLPDAITSSYVAQFALFYLWQPPRPPKWRWVDEAIHPNVASSVSGDAAYNRHTAGRVGCANFTADSLRSRSSTEALAI